MDRRAEYIEVLIGSLERVLDALDGNSVELGCAADPIVEACEAAFAQFKTEAQRFAKGESSEELKQRIQHAVKLHALAASGAKRAKALIGENLEGSAQRRQRRKAFQSSPRVGDSCDMAG